MQATYSADLVAPALAGLSATQLANLVNQETYGEWLAKQISLTSAPDNFSPDSQEASEAAGAAGEAEYQATQVLATLSEDQQAKLLVLARCAINGDAVEELMALMPV